MGQAGVGRGAAHGRVRGQAQVVVGAEQPQAVHALLPRQGAGRRSRERVRLIEHRGGVACNPCSQDIVRHRNL